MAFSLLVASLLLLSTVSAQDENQGFFVSPGSFTIKDVPPKGEPYTIPRDIVIHNGGDNSRKAFMSVEVPPEDAVASGYEPIPNENWVSPVPKSITIEGNSSATVKFSMNLPNWENLTGKKWEVWIPVERQALPGEVAVLRPTVKVNIETVGGAVENQLENIEENLSGGPEEGTVEKLQKPIENLELEVENLSERMNNLTNAISEGKVGASVSIRTEADGKHRVTKEFKRKIQIEVKKVNVGKEVEIEVSSDIENGRSVVINLDNETIGNTTKATVLYDGEKIGLADDYKDVLNPNEEKAEYLIILGGKGAQVLLSIPNFSTHTITITTEEDLSGGEGFPLAWVGIGLGIVIAIAAFLVGRKQVAGESRRQSLRMRGS